MMMIIMTRVMTMIMMIMMIIIIIVIIVIRLSEQMTGIANDVNQGGDNSAPLIIQPAADH